jgi:hypothetical protein
LAADNAAVTLKDSGITHGDAIGILALDSDGKLKQDKVGARSTGKGAAIGGVLFLLGPAVLGVGVIGGTAVGALHHKNLGLSDADKARLSVELTSGRAAVGVLSHFDTAHAISERLTQLGGASEAHELSDESAGVSLQQALLRCISIVLTVRTGQRPSPLTRSSSGARSAGTPTWHQSRQAAGRPISRITNHSPSAGDADSIAYRTGATGRQPTASQSARHSSNRHDDGSPFAVTTLAAGCERLDTLCSQRRPNAQCF